MQLGDAERIVRCVSHILFGACSVVGGGGGSIFWKTSHTALLYVCMYFVPLTNIYDKNNFFILADQQCKNAPKVYNLFAHYK